MKGHLTLSKVKQRKSAIFEMMKIYYRILSIQKSVLQAVKDCLKLQMSEMSIAEISQQRLHLYTGEVSLEEY